MLSFFSTSRRADSARNRFETELQQQLLTSGERILRDYIKNADKDIRKELRSVLTLAVRQLEQSVGGSNRTTRSRLPAGTENLDFTQWQNTLSGVLSGILEDQISQVLTRTRTSTRSGESSRSQEVLTRFRESRSQQRFDALQEASNGQRNG